MHAYLVIIGHQIRAGTFNDLSKAAWMRAQLAIGLHGIHVCLNIAYMAI